VASYNGILEFAFKFEVNCTAVELDPNSYIANSDVILEVFSASSVLTFSVDLNDVRKKL